MGPIVERLSGHSRFAAVYTLSAITGTLASYAFTTAPSVGASGAIFGVGGALAVFFYRHKGYFGSTSDAVLKALGQSLAINVVMGFVVSNVDNWQEGRGVCSGVAGVRAGRSGTQGSGGQAGGRDPLQPRSTPSRLRRGHFGGILGGAAAAALLGPRLVVTRSDGGKGPGVVKDEPLVPWLAAKPQDLPAKA